MTLLRKVLLVASIILLILIVLAVVRVIRPSSIDSYEPLMTPAQFDHTREIDYVATYANIDKALNKPILSADSIDRNITVEKRVITQEPTFILRSIKEEIIPIVFKGSIVRGASTIIAQINWGNKTHFVKPGETLKGWEIREITKDSVLVKDTDGKEFRLSLNTVTRSEELIASIMYTPKDQIYRVKKGEEIRGHKVVDIKKDGVIVSKNNSRITISYNK